MNTKYRPPLGHYLYERRTALGLTMAEAADRAGTSAAYWSQIEGGQVKLPGADLRRRIAEAINVSHLALLVAAGELTPAEAGQPETPELREIERALLAAVAGLEDREVARVVRIARDLYDMLHPLSDPAPADPVGPRRKPPRQMPSQN